MKKYSTIIKEGHTYKYDLSNSIRLLEEAMEKINSAKEEISKLDDADIDDLEEGWNLIDKYYGNVVRGEIYKRKKKLYIPNVSATFPKKGDS
jgi:hypothetical protein